MSEYASIYNERSTLRMCLEKVGLGKISPIVQNANNDTIKDLLEIVINEAKRLQSHEVMEDLYFAGLHQGGL